MLAASACSKQHRHAQVYVDTTSTTAMLDKGQQLCRQPYTWLVALIPCGVILDSSVSTFHFALHCAFFLGWTGYSSLQPFWVDDQAFLALFMEREGATLQFWKKKQLLQAGRLKELAGASCNDKEDELTLVGLYLGRIGSALARAFSWNAWKLTWCDNGIQSEAAVVVSGCFASCYMFNDRQLVSVSLCCCPCGMQQKREEFVHNTRCANISQALTAGIGHLSLQWLTWSGRHKNHIGAQTVESLWGWCLAWVHDIGMGKSEGNHGKLVNAISGSAAWALTASLSMTLGPFGPCIWTIFKAAHVGICLHLFAGRAFKRQLPGWSCQ